MKKPVFQLPPNIPILGVFFFDNFGFVIVLPIFAHILLDPGQHFVSETLPLESKFLILGFLLASFPFAQFFGAPIFGQIGDNIGKKKAFIITLSGMTVGYFLTAMSLQFYNIYLLFVGRVVTGFFAANRALCLAAFSDHFADAKIKKKRYGELTTIEGVSFTLSVMLGGWTSDFVLNIDFSVALPLWITFIISFGSIFFVILTYEDKNPVSEHAKMSFAKGARDIGMAIKTPGVRSVAFIHFFLVLSWMTMLQFNSTYLIQRFHTNLFNITITYIIVGVLWAVCSWSVYSLLLQKFAHKSVLKVGFLILTLFMLTCFFSPEIVFYVVFLSLATCVASILWPSSLFLGTYLRNKTYHGRIQGVYQSMKSLALIIGPICMSFLLEFDINYLHLFTSCAAFLGFCVTYFFFKQHLVKADRPT